MGQAKRAWEEYNDRGWLAPVKVVCQHCVDDDFLKSIIQRNSSARQCTYCGRRTRGNSAAPVESLMPTVASALNYFYAEPTMAGVPYEQGFVIEPTDTADALMGLPFGGHDDLLSDVADSFSNTAWVRSAGGHWAASHENEEWSWAWRTFAQKVKHQCRYFFTTTGTEFESWGELEPFDVLGRIGRIAIQLRLLAHIPEKTPLFRVRERMGDAEWSISGEELGAPPNHLANAGRMNPAGISYMYLSKTREGALAEVLHGANCKVVIGIFEATRPLAVLDLTSLPPLPSVFDSEKRQTRESILFLNDFVGNICQPVMKDGREHINYVPSQVVSEYFSHIFRTPEDERLDGIVYPSAVSPKSVNVVLFPRDDGQDSFCRSMKFVWGAEESFET